MVQVSPPRPSSISPKVGPRIPTTPEEAESSGLNEEKEERRRKSDNRDSRKIASHDKTSFPPKSLKRSDKEKEAHTSSEGYMKISS